jgi:hypothetical protein
VRTVFERTCDLLDRARESRAGAKGPEPGDRVGKNNPDCHRVHIVVERLHADRVKLREAKYDSVKTIQTTAAIEIRYENLLRWVHTNRFIYDAQGDRNSR